MGRVRTIFVMAVVAAVMLVGAAVAYAGEWWWNAQIDVEGAELRTVWTVNADGDGSNYQAAITVVLPEGAQAALNVLASNETVAFATHDGLDCDDDSLEAVVTYNVSALPGAIGQRVKVDVVADGARIGGSTGALGEDIIVNVQIPADDPSCS